MIDHDSQGSGWPGQLGNSLLGLLIALAVIGLTAWFVISRYSSAGVGALADAGLQLDETKRQRTIGDMRVIGDAIRLMQADTGRPPGALAALQDGRYLALVPMVDGWGNAWTYTVGRDGFSLTSMGSDGRAGPDPPTPWGGGSYACDLVMRNGQMTQAPAGS